MQERVKRLQGLFDGIGVDAFYVTAPENRFYLSGFSGTSGALLLCRDSSYLITDFRYTSQASRECPGFEIIEAPGSGIEALAGLCQKDRVSQLGCEGDDLTYARFQTLRQVLTGVALKPVSGVVEGLRLYKDDYELRCIEEAVRIADRAFTRITGIIRPGVPETEVALELEFLIRRLGADGIGFATIVASGTRSALPHGVASAKIIEAGDLVTLDFGAVYRGYHSDITRMVVVGQTTPRQENIYNIVLEAQRSAIAAVQAGVRASEVDRAARDIIKKNGYGDYFGHGTGHGLGLDIHEGPRLSAKDDTVLQAGMAVTVEPGIYLPDWGGVRIEDTVLVENGGCRVLTGSPKDKLLSL
ncbi:MAG TPA: Xaa-Pro dipeptidase [Pelotomaculum sp.]|nr:Xaa-Pro dipeptidase [Pelotomaculum sp.]